MKDKSAWGGLLAASCLWACSPSGKVDLPPGSGEVDGSAADGEGDDVSSPIKSTSPESGEVDGNVSDGAGDEGWIVVVPGAAEETCILRGGSYICPDGSVVLACAESGDATAVTGQVCDNSLEGCLGCFEGAGYGCGCVTGSDGGLVWGCVGTGYTCHTDGQW